MHTVRKVSIDGSSIQFRPFKKSPVRNAPMIRSDRQVFEMAVLLVRWSHILRCLVIPHIASQLMVHFIHEDTHDLILDILVVQQQTVEVLVLG